VTPRLRLEAEGLRFQDGPAADQPAPIAFGRDVRPGDLVLLDYLGFDGSPRTWDHVGVLAADRGLPGRLDPADAILHLGYLHGLVEEPASTQAPAIIQVLRFVPSVERAFLHRAPRRTGPARAAR
jgi:hypothetical protein